MAKSFGILIVSKPRKENLGSEPLAMPSAIIEHTQKILNVLSEAMKNTATFLATYGDTEKNSRVSFEIQTQCAQTKFRQFAKIPELVFVILERSIRVREAHITNKDKLDIERISQHRLTNANLIKIEQELNIIAKKIVNFKNEISVKLLRVDGKDTTNQMANTPYLGDLFTPEEPKLPLMPPPPASEQIEIHQLKVSAKRSKKSEELLNLSVHITTQAMQFSSTPKALDKLVLLINSMLIQLNLTAEINMAPDKNGFHKIIGITDEREDKADPEDTETS